MKIRIPKRPKPIIGGGRCRIVKATVADTPIDAFLSLFKDSNGRPLPLVETSPSRTSNRLER